MYIIVSARRADECLNKHTQEYKIPLTSQELLLAFSEQRETYNRKMLEDKIKEINELEGKEVINKEAFMSDHNATDEAIYRLRNSQLEELGDIIKSVKAYRLP